MLWNWLREQLEPHSSQVVEEGEKCITYEQLVCEAEQWDLASAPSKIGICCRSEWNAARAFFFCWAAGKTAVPLPVRYGEIHYRRIIEAVGLTCLLTDEGGELHLRRIAEEEPEEEILCDVAVILCTSGTTGVPKGVMLTDQALISNLKAIRKYFPLDSSDCFFIARPLYHCAVLVGEFLSALIRGAEVRFYPYSFNPPAMLAEMKRDRSSVFCGTPTLFYHLSRFAERRKEPVSLRMAAVSGECLTPELARILQAAFPETSFYHVYGLTEAGPRACWLPPDEFLSKAPSVGYPLNGVDAMVVDKSGRVLLWGEEGELLLRTPSVMKGYYRRPEMTAHALAGGWLHTGDMARRDARGRITILSRMDDMIIRGGINIYPQEIEAALQRIPGVQEAMAYGERDSISGQKIRVKVVAPGMESLSLLRACQDRLPPHQWPDSIELTSHLPRNGSGKLIRKGVS